MQLRGPLAGSKEAGPEARGASLSPSRDSAARTARHVHRPKPPKSQFYHVAPVVTGLMSSSLRMPVGCLSSTAGMVTKRAPSLPGSRFRGVLTRTTAEWYRKARMRLFMRVWRTVHLGSGRWKIAKTLRRGSLARVMRAVVSTQKALGGS